MSARNYLSPREKNVFKLGDCLPSIHQNNQKFGHRIGLELPPLSANTGVNRNLHLHRTYDFQNYDLSTADRAGTPLSDFFSESETGTPDFLTSEESDSSAGSILRQSTAEASRILAKEWEKIERTLYDEEGEKCTRPQMIEECKQWKQLHPHFRVIGHGMKLPDKRICVRQFEHDEIIAMHYSDYEEFSESEERLSQSSSDVTPENSPRISGTELLIEPRLMRDKVTFHTPSNEEVDFPNEFCSLLQITPIQIHSPSQRKRQNPCILRSEIASSKWMRNRQDSFANYERNSAKSFLSLDTRNSNNFVLSASERNNFLNTALMTPRHRDLARLDPITPDVMHDAIKTPNGITRPYSVRKVSLPPLLLDDEKKKVIPVGSAKRNNFKPRKSTGKNLFHLDRVIK